ncbi:TetR/AcrR family transcriptional regulator [Frigidibacter sp. ROC022]|uniref:TetR/AcrR family transcriptional regulator n=1 Tax=Frigidibacter sp. ROC022 TaxID=2971796 RepID=UPI0023DEC1D2|nr:TetR/AcrR family transcriptional regulator [Frigidibacter sp. ROC022]
MFQNEATQTARDPGRAAAILEAALRLFSAQGYAATTLAQIRAESGASTGSIYHFFKGKPGIAYRLWRQALGGWARASGPISSEAPAERAIRASVGGLLAWGSADPALFRFLEEVRARARCDPDFARIKEELAQGARASAGLYGRWVAAGAVQDLPWPVARALMLGPAYDWLADGGGPADQARALEDAAWHAVARA